MKAFALLLTLALCLQGCGSNTASNTASQGAPAERPTPTPLPPLSPPKDQPDTPPKPAKDGRTPAALYAHLKASGWQFGELTPVPTRMFGSEESASFRDPQDVGFLAMRFDTKEAASANFERINESYKRKLGRAVMAENFVVAVFGYTKGINEPKIIQLEGANYGKLQADLEAFFKKPQS